MQLLLLLFTTPAAAAPCCGGGAAIPSLITGDDAAQLSASMASSSVIGDAPAQGLPVFRADGDNERSQTLKLDGAYRVADRYQLGATIPVVRRAREVASNRSQQSGLGDVTIDAAFEVLPELSYSWWKPHGFLFVESTIPTSPSTYDSLAPFQIDARGRGFFQIGVGAAFVKAVGDWDLIASLEAHRSLDRTFAIDGQGETRLKPGFGGVALLGAGLSPASGPLRIGLALSPVYEGPIGVEGDVQSTSSAQLVWNTVASLSYMLGTDWTVALSYIDQTLVGPARNVAMSRSGALSLQKRWAL